MNTMITRMPTCLALAFTLSLSVAAPAFASGDYVCDYVPKESRLPKDEVRAALKAKSYDVRQIDMSDNCYEVYALDPEGKRVEIYVDPATGKIAKEAGYDD